MASVDAVEATQFATVLLDDQGAPGGRAEPAGSPVSVELLARDGVTAPADVSPTVAVRVAGSDRARMSGFQRVAFTVGVAGLLDGALAEGVSRREARDLGRKVDVRLVVDYGRFVDEFGADWAGRLRLVRFAPCALSKDRTGCPGATPVEGVVNDRANGTLSATVPLGSLVAEEEGKATRTGDQMVSGFALLAGSSSETGDYSATSLNPQGSWAVGSQSGDFSWSYPIAAPAPPAGAAPGVSVGYSSAAIDGLTADQNTQGGALGPGWSMSEGFIERQYTTCAADGGAGADFCWKTDNGMFSFGGMSAKLVHVGSEVSLMAGWDANVYRLESHTGWAVVRYSRNTATGKGSVGVDDNGEYWVATAPDGTKYYFGYGAETGDGAPGTSLDSVQTVPVVGNHAGEPCNTQSYNWCHQAYRWSLDRIEDANGRVTTFHYSQELNYYGIRGTPGWSEPYVSAAPLVRIEYGQLPSTAVAANGFSHQVTFGYHYRCNNPESDGVCRTAPTAATAANFPDVPVDQFCGDATCYHYAPTFFNRQQLRRIWTGVRDATGAMETISTDAFVTEWLDADGTGSDPSRLWLRSIQHSGHQGGSGLTLPPVRFFLTALPNRVDYNNWGGVTQMKYYRINSIVDEYGAEIRVAYTQPKPCPSPWPSSPPAGWGGFQNNTWSCFPRYWTPPSGPSGFSVWHKYVVNSVIEIDQSGDWYAATKQWDYQYPQVTGSQGGMAWHSDDNPYAPVSTRSWGEYRGFQQVRVVVGYPTETNRISTETVFHRGMHNDINSHSDPNEPRDVVSTPSTLGAATDSDQLAGRPREEFVTDFNNSTNLPGTQLYSAAVTDYVSYATAGTGATSWQVEADLVRSRSSYGGVAKYGRVDYVFDSHAWTRRLNKVVDYGRVSSAYANLPGDDGLADDNCTVTGYTPSGGRFRDGLAWLQQAYGAADCATTLLSDVRTYYDDAEVEPNSAPAPTAVPWFGNPTAVWRRTGGGVTAEDGTVPVGVIDRTSYEAPGYWNPAGWGRPKSTTNARGQVAEITYTPFAPSLGTYQAKLVSVRNPLGHTTVTEYDLYGNERRSTDPNTRTTYVCHDALGRLNRVYEPGVPGGSTCTGSASKTFGYTFSYVTGNSSAPTPVPRWSVQTRTLFALAADTSFNPSSTDTYVESWALFDGFGRLAQTNTPSPAGGRVVTLTRYDSQDNAIRQTQPFHSAAATGSAWTIPSLTAIPRSSLSTFDPLGRPTKVEQLDNDVSVRSTSTSYTPDRTTSSPAVATGQSSTFGATVHWAGADGNVWKVTENSNAGANRDTKYQYDRAGNLTMITDSASNVTRLTYNLLGWRLSLDDPNAGFSNSNYYPTGEIRYSVDAANKTVFHRIDALGRTISTHSSVSWNTSNMLGAFGYDGFSADGTIPNAKGYLTLADAYGNGGGVIRVRNETVAFDAAGRPTQTRITVPAADGPLGADENLVGPHVLTRSYTRNGAVWRQTEPGVPGSNQPNGETVDTEFNTLGLPTRLGNYTSLIEYDNLGRQVRSTMGPTGQQAGLVTQTLYQDSDGRLARQIATTGTGNVLQDDTYTYDAPGNPTRITHNTTQDDETECFDYDTRQRLTRAYTLSGIVNCAAAGTTVTPTGPSPYLETYTVDHVGRIMNFDGNTRAHGAASPTGCRTGTQSTKPHALKSSTGGGQTDTFTYNCVGAITQQVTTGGPTPGTTTYNYDHQDRLTTTVNSEGTTTNVYDTTNNRVLRVDPDGSRTLYLGNTEVRYVPWFGTYVSRTFGQSRKGFLGEITNFAVNHQGTIAATTTAAGTSRLRTTPYGTPRTLPGGATHLEDHNFLNQIDDPNTNTVYLNNRHYMPRYSAFISVDPFVFIFRPATLNSYSYSLGSPITYSDRSGLCATDPSVPPASGDVHGTNCELTANPDPVTPDVDPNMMEAVPTVTNPGQPSGWVERPQSTGATCWFLSIEAVCDFGGGFKDGVVGSARLVGGLAADGFNCVRPGGCPDGYEPQTTQAIRHVVTNPTEILKHCLSVGIARCAGEIVGGGRFGRAVGRAFSRARAAVAALRPSRSTSAVLGAVTRKVAATGDELLRPGPWAGEGVPLGTGGAVSRAQRKLVNQQGNLYGCHSCGKLNPRTKSGNWVTDHQPAWSLAMPPYTIFPHCVSCSNRQGGHLSGILPKIDDQLNGR